MFRTVFICLLSFIPKILLCQQARTPVSVAAEDPSTELGQLKKNCLFKHVIGCAEVLITGQPIHLAVGSLPPQNGVGFGLAYVGHKTTDNWRISWNGDGVASPNASWRTGIYVKFVDSRQADVGVQMGTKNAESDPTELPEQPVINVYVQTISLNKLIYYGLGPGTLVTSQSFYGMTETISGVGAVRSIFARAHIGVYGDVDGRWVQLRPSQDQSSPSIEQLYTEVTTPGLNNQPFFMRLGAGVRARPSFREDLFHLNYDVAYRPYLAVSNSHYTFQKFDIDLSHQMSLYRKTYRETTGLLLPRDTNGPDDCLIDASAERPRCSKATTRNLEGSIGLRLFTTLTQIPSGHVVPFYFQPTIGGSDINGNAWLGSYPDYRFRAPNLLVFRENFEHSIWKLPVGFAFLADQGKVAPTPGDLGSSHWKHSYSTGLTLRAGGFPQVYLMFAWGGSEGPHTTATINNSLLGSSSRPSLF